MNQNIKSYIDHCFRRSDCQSIELTAFAENINHFSSDRPIKFDDWYDVYFVPTWNKYTGAPTPKTRRTNYCRGGQRQIKDENKKKGALLAPPYNQDMWYFNEDYFNDETISYILEKTREKKYKKTRAKLLEDRADELAKKTEGLLGNVFSGELQAQDGGIDGMTMVRGVRVPYQAKNISLDIDTFLSYYNSYKSRDYLGGAFYANNVAKELIDYLHRLFSDGNCITVLKCEFILPKKEYNNYIIEWTY